MSDLLDEKGFEPMPIPCEQEQNITEIKTMIAGLTTEFRGILNEMRGIFVEDREHKIRIAANEKAIQVLFDRQKEIKAERDACMRDKIEPLVDWRNRNDGGLEDYKELKKKVGKIEEWKHNLQGSIAALQIIPLICVIVTTILAYWTFSVATHEKNEFSDHGIIHEHESRTYGVDEK